MSHKKKRINEKLKKSNPAKLETVPHTKVGREFSPHTKSDTVMSFVSTDVILLGTGILFCFKLSVVPL
jgi:hypothetical protein